MTDLSGSAVLCFDGGEASKRAVGIAARLLRSRQAVVATVWHDGDGSSAAEQARRVAADGCVTAQQAGMAAEPWPLASRDAADALAALAGEIDAGALVAGGCPPGARRLRRLGGVTRALVHCADRPVLIAHGGATGAGPVVLGYDGSDASRLAITRAAHLLGDRRALVVHAWLAPSHVLLWNPLIKGPGPLAEPAAMLDEASAQAARRLADEGAEHARAAGLEAEPCAVPVTRGTWRTLLRSARERDARAIVVGSRGWSALDAALGTVADRVTTHADRPVLLVPGGEAGQDRRA